MDDLTPKKAYHPEEEYKSLELEQNGFDAGQAQTGGDAVTEPVADAPANEIPVKAINPESMQKYTLPQQPQQQTPPAQPAAYPNTAPYGYPYYP